MIDLYLPLKMFSKKVIELQFENSVIVESVHKLWREHYDEEYIQRKDFIKDVDNLLEGNFTNLFQSSVISLYTYLETAIKELICRLITYYVENNMATQVPEIANVTISLVDFINLDGDEKYKYLTSAYEKQQGASIPYGVDRFERLLKPFELSNELDKKLKQSINELGQTRNNLIHKSGVVDAWFMKHCGWLHSKYKIGDQLIVNHEQLEHWINSAVQYTGIIEKRMKNSASLKF